MKVSNVAQSQQPWLSCNELVGMYKTWKLLLFQQCHACLMFYVQNL